MGGRGGRIGEGVTEGFDGLLNWGQGQFQSIIFEGQEHGQDRGGWAGHQGHGSKPSNKT